MPPPASTLPDKNDLFAQYQILEDLGDFPSYSLFKVKAPNGSIKLWKKVDLQFNAASIETRLLPVIEKVSHPYLNAVSGSFLFQDKGLLFVESEFPAKTLRHRLDEIRANAGGQQNVGIPISELFGYMSQAAEAIDYLNTSQHLYQGKKIAIYHRALSPDSLHLFEDKGKIVCKVGDFGLAKPITDSNEAARHSLGLTNYDYAPPEFDEGLTTNTSDQYSLATTYHELRTGRLPFTGSLLQKLQAQLSGNPDLSLLEANERPIVARALSRDPHARFPSCRDFIRQLQLALGGVVTVPLAAPSPGGGARQTSAAEPTGSTGSLFGGANSGWALSARPVGRTGGALFNVQAKGPINTPAKPEGFTMAAPAASATPPPTPAAMPRVPATPKAPEIRPQPARVPTPAQAEGWSMETAQDKSVTTPPPPAPGKAPASSPKGTGTSNPDIRITPPPQPPARADSISSKARETLELIKRKQAGPAVPPAPPPLEKPVPGSKFFSAGSTGGMSALPPTRGQAARPTSKPAGALGETPAASRPPNIPTPRRASTPNMGVPLPSRNVSAQPAAPRTASPVGLPQRRSSSGLSEPAGGSSADPFDAIRNNLPASRGERPSWVTLLMVSIAAFCIGMLILAYLARK